MLFKMRLKMIDNRKFITALKSTWIRWILHSNSEWVPLLKSTIHCNTGYLWKRGYYKSFLEGYFIMLDSCWWNTSKTKMNIWYEQIWDNPKIQIKNKFIFLKHFLKAGIFLLYDLYNICSTVKACYENINGCKPL